MNALPSPEQVSADLAGHATVTLGRLRSLYNIGTDRWAKLLADADATHTAPSGPQRVEAVLQALHHRAERESVHGAARRLGISPEDVRRACEWAGLTKPHPSGHSAAWHLLRREDIEQAIKAHRTRERKPGGSPTRPRPPCIQCGKPVRFLGCAHCSNRCAQDTRHAEARARAARWRQRYEAGESVYRIAKDEGVNSGTVGYAVGKYQRSGTGTGTGQGTGRAA